MSRAIHRGTASAFAPLRRDKAQRPCRLIRVSCLASRISGFGLSVSIRVHPCLKKVFRGRAVFVTLPSSHCFAETSRRAKGTHQSSPRLRRDRGTEGGFYQRPSVWISGLICGFEAGGQGVNQRGIPVDGDFVGSVILRFIMPIGCLGMRAADEITGPRVRPVVAAGAAVVRMQRRTETDSRDE